MWGRGTGSEGGLSFWEKRHRSFGVCRNYSIHLICKPSNRTAPLSKRPRVTRVPDEKPSDASLGSRLLEQPSLGVGEVAAARSSLKSRHIVQ